MGSLIPAVFYATVLSYFPFRVLLTLALDLFPDNATWILSQYDITDKTLYSCPYQF